MEDYLNIFCLGENRGNKSIHSFELWDDHMHKWHMGSVFRSVTISLSRSSIEDIAFTLFR